MPTFRMRCRRPPNLLLSSFLILTVIFHVAFSVDDYSDDGSISINCGSEKEYYDDITGRRYITDQGFVDTGSNRDIYGVSTSQNLPAQLKDLRVFTEGKRNCYVLRLRQGGNYLIRALFMYGNYDGKEQTPVFDLYLGNNKWKTVTASDPEPDNYVYHEIIYDFPMNTTSVNVCLVNIDRGTPFISALELRPILDTSIYPADSGIALSTAYRYDLGYNPGDRWDMTNESHIINRPESIGGVLQSRRYRDDPYDRIWSQYNDTSLWSFIIDDDIQNNPYHLPEDVWKTLVTTNFSDPDSYCINFSFSTTNQNNTTAQYYAYFHFASFKWDEGKMSIYLNDAILDKGPILSESRVGLTQAYPILDINVNEVIKLSICTSQGSKYRPILNAIEIYEQVHLSNIWTNPEVEAYISARKNVVIAAVAVTLVIAVAIAIAIVWWKRKQKRQVTISREIMLPKSGEIMLPKSGEIMLPKSGETGSGNSRYSEALQSKNPEFSYSQVLKITNNFQTVIGGGGFGKVYLGALEDGTRVAVKLLSENSVQGKKEYYYEALILSKVHHANLVSLVGYCNDGQNMMLIYEYMPNGNLRQHLSENSATALDWRRRLEIAKHAAQGLDYLHNGCKPPIIHRDVKTSNILLDENWRAKISDFGLSRNSEIEGNAHTTAVAGTFAYMDPEYLGTRKMNMKSDVYSFGVVLLELITGKSAMIKGSKNLHVIHWTRSLVENGDIQSIMDPKLYGNFKSTVAWKAVEIAMSCVSPFSVRRPEISQVFVELKECLEIEISPEKSEGSLTMSSIEFDTSVFPCPR